MNFTAAESITMNGDLQNDGTLSGTTGTWAFQKAGGGGTISGSNSITVAAAELLLPHIQTAGYSR